MDTHFNASVGLQAGGAYPHPGWGNAGDLPPAAAGGTGSSMMTPQILGQGSSAGLLNSLDSLGTGTGSSGSSGSSLVNALQGLAQMLLGGGNGSGAGSGFTLSLPQYQQMPKADQNDTRDIAPSPAGVGGGNDD
jgi:hypothetical protein